MAPGATIDATSLSAGISLVKTSFTSPGLPEGVSATCFAAALIPGSCTVTNASVRCRLQVKLSQWRHSSHYSIATTRCLYWVHDCRHR